MKEPKYQIIQTFDEESIEVREYPQLLVAEVTVEGSRSEAANQAFRPLFNYISGENTVREEIEMTAPVTQEQAEDASTEIEMTAPVTQKPGPEDEAWVVAFVMPERFTLQTLPEPKNEQIRLREIEGKRVAVYRSSGSWSDEALEEKRRFLANFLDGQGMAYGDYQYAFYDPPFMPSFLRRNEVIYELK
ncbi:SOUL family heme-binding protein [Cerasicoccus fimbriatus]|uniref:SOUL family heme-binding protein n=1 Tax=Cerasicoccus fimbriatus TaxID=3014554 RepID=UPI0022B3A0C8|nr:heme-binding protein [Cerasicoccus sp. TK19100]